MQAAPPPLPSPRPNVPAASAHAIPHQTLRSLLTRAERARDAIVAVQQRVQGWNMDGREYMADWSTLLAAYQSAQIQVSSLSNLLSAPSVSFPLSTSYAHPIRLIPFSHPEYYTSINPVLMPYQTGQYSTELEKLMEDGQADFGWPGLMETRALDPKGVEQLQSELSTRLDGVRERMRRAATVLEELGGGFDWAYRAEDYSEEEGDEDDDEEEEMDEAVAETQPKSQKSDPKPEVMEIDPPTIPLASNTPRPPPTALQTETAPVKKEREVIEIVDSGSGEEDEDMEEV